MLNCYCQLYLFCVVNCQVQLFLDNMVLANQNATLTGPDQGFLVSRLVLTLKPWERGWVVTEKRWVGLEMGGGGDEQKSEQDVFFESEENQD